MAYRYNRYYEHDEEDYMFDDGTDPFTEALWRRYYKYDEEDYTFDDGTDPFTKALWRGIEKACSTSKKDKKILTSLKYALNNLQKSAGSECGSFAKSYFCTESSFNSENMHVTVEGVGDLKFPLKPDTVKKLSAISSKAKFGKGSETLLDLSVRDTEMIPASKLKVDIDDTAYSALVQEISAGLNIDTSCTVVPHLHNMLLYGPQQFFERHTDTEKIENMIATLVVILPSFYRGGELVISCGCYSDNQKNVRFTPSEDPNKIKWIAFHPDCKHWVEKVTEGFRVVLTFNVEMKLPSEITNTLSTTDISGELNKCVAEFFNGLDRPKKLIYLLNHSYSENSLKWQLLKGSDRIQGHALYLVAKNQNLVPCLALVVDEEFLGGLDGDKLMSTIKVRYLVGKDSEQLLIDPAFPLEFGNDREICYTIKSMCLLDYFEYCREGFNGNEASKKEFRYHRACVILCDASLISTATANEKMKSLTPKVIEAVKEISKDTSDGADTVEAQQNKPKKIIVEGTLSSSEVVVSVHNEGRLTYPPPKTVVQKLIQMSEGEERVEPHVILPNRVNVEINSPVWNRIISNISFGLGVNSKCKLVPNLRGLRLYDDFHKDLGVEIAPLYCKYHYPKCSGCWKLGHGDFCCGELKGERGDITLVIILPGLTNGKFSIKYAGESHTISDWNKLESMKYIACYSDLDIAVSKLKGTCLYLMYNLELQSDLQMCHEIDISIVDEPLSNAIKDYFSDDIQPKKLVYLLNHDYAKKKLRWHMLKGPDETAAHAFYAVAKKQNLVPYLAYTEIREHWSDAFSSIDTKMNDFSRTVTETHVKLIFLVDENNVEIKPSSDQFHLVSEGEVCFAMTNEVRSKPIKINTLSLTENIRHYNRACVVLCAN